MLLPALGFVQVGSAALATPTPGQRQAGLLLRLFDTPAAAPAAGVQPSRRRRYTLDVFGEEPIHGRTVRLRARGSSATARPKLYMMGVSFSPQADTAVSRYTAWDTGGILADKLVKGAILDVDTRGQDRTVEVQGDGETLATFTCNTPGRRVVQFSWQQFKARIIRLRPTNASHWRLYSLQWIFDEEPLQLTRWETQPQTHGVLNWHTLTTLHVSYRSSAVVTLVIQAFDRAGNPTERTYSLDATADAKRVAHVLCFATQGLLYKYIFSSPANFHIYREESMAEIQAWGEADVRQVQPFGNDDLAAPSRAMRTASGVASRAGGGS